VSGPGRGANPSISAGIAAEIKFRPAVPTSRKPAEPNRWKTRPMSNASAPRFLVVDDFSTMRRVVRGQLKQMGFEDVAEAEDGMAALARLKSQPFDFVICDIGMPIMSGIDLLKTVRTDAGLRHIPMLMVTAEARKEDIVLAMQCGAAGYLVKPFTVEALEERVRKALRDHASAA
jgi:two-component system chemotaxis response regulator CheY